MSSNSAKVLLTDCWNHIGTWGRELPRCPRLDDVIHCHNCDHYSEAGRQLLDRDLPAQYRENWRTIYQQEKLKSDSATQGVIVFRVFNEWFGLPVNRLSEIAEYKPIHSIPHRTNEVLRGLVNIRGSLKLCIALSTLLNVARVPTEANNLTQILRRMIIVNAGRDDYVFAVDEIAKIVRYAAADVRLLPSTVRLASNNFLTGLLAVDSRDIGLIDVGSLFLSIERNLM